MGGICSKKIRSTSTHVTETPKLLEKESSDPLDTNETREPSLIIDAARRPHNTIGPHVIQNYLLFWLDAHINESVDDFNNSLTYLRRIVNTIHIFTDVKCCIEYLNEIENEKVIIIVSGDLGQHVVPAIHDSPQLDSIFVFCYDRMKHEQWVNGWDKINGVFTEILEICEALRIVTRRCEQTLLPITFIATDDILKRTSHQLDSSFMYTQILKEILLSIKFDQQHIQDFIEYCRNILADNERELKNIEKLEQQYQNKSAIWWYTCESFLYPMLNRALRLIDFDIIIRMGFFINDLHRHIKQLHHEQFGSDKTRNNFTVYRGQGIPKVDFEQMIKIEDGLLSFNNFLSTSKDRSVSLGFARHVLANSDLVGILFVMSIDPAKSTTPFASISDVSYYGDKENEILFSTHTVFRIHGIAPIDNNHRLFQVNLKLTDDNDTDLNALTDRIREEIGGGSVGFDSMGKFLIKAGQFGKAEEIYQSLLEQAANDVDSAHFHHMLGHIKDEQGKYETAFSFYDKSLEIYLTFLPPNHARLAVSYNNIGSVYDKMGKYQEALVFYNEALKVLKETRSENHSDLATCYINIGLVYNNMGKYAEALSSYEQGLAIDQQTLPPNHPSLAISYNNIGLAYYNAGDYPKALQLYEQALEIQHQSLLSNHPDLALSYNSIGAVYENMNDYSKARLYYGRAVAIAQQSLSPDHPNQQTYKQNLEAVKEK